MPTDRKKLGKRQQIALGFLNVYGPLASEDLADMLPRKWGMSEEAVSKLLDRLEDLGYIDADNAPIRREAADAD